MAAEAWLALKLLLLIGVANSAPILAKRWLGTHAGVPLDGGLRFFDGERLLGPSKTLRGVAAAVAATALAAPWLGLTAANGAAIGAAAMAGDALSSFVKRRLRLAPSAKATGLDQIPESLLPLLALRDALDLAPGTVAAVTLLFFALEIPLARLSHRLGLRDTPY